MKFSNPFSRNTRTEKHVPRFPGAAPNSPGIGAPVTPVLASGVDASGQAGPVFAQGAQGAFGLQAVDVVLSSAQLLALLGTAVTIVPAPAAGFRIVPLYFKIIYTGGSVAYTDAGGAVSFNAGTMSYPLASNAIFLVTVSPNRRAQDFVSPGGTDTAANPPTDDGAALTISKATNNLAAGNGTAKITCYFVVEPTT
jgi:hypothetical protein